MRTVIVAGEFVWFALGILERTFLGVKAEEIKFTLEGLLRLLEVPHWHRCFMA